MKRKLEHTLLYLNEFKQPDWISAKEEFPAVDTSDKDFLKNKISKPVICYSSGWVWKLSIGRYSHKEKKWILPAVQSLNAAPVEKWTYIIPK